MSKPVWKNVTTETPVNSVLIAESFSSPPSLTTTKDIGKDIFKSFIGTDKISHNF